MRILGRKLPSCLSAHLALPRRSVNEALQRPSLGILHDDVQIVVVEERVVEADDVGVVHPREDSALRDAVVALRVGHPGERDLLRSRPGSLGYALRWTVQLGAGCALRTFSAYSLPSCRLRTA